MKPGGRNVKEIVASYPKEGSRKEKHAFINSAFAELGIKPRYAVCGCCVFLMFLGIIGCMMGGGMILLTRNLTISGSNTVLRAGNGEPVATAEATIKVNLAKLRTVAGDPGTNQKFLRDLTEVAFKIEVSAGLTEYITMRVAETHVESNTASAGVGVLKMYSPVGNHVTVSSDTSVHPQFCNPTICRDIVMSRRLTEQSRRLGHDYHNDACCDDDVFEIYQIQQVPTEEYREEEEVSSASWGTKIAGIILLCVLAVVFCISAVLCPEALSLVIICCECAAACA